MGRIITTTSTYDILDSKPIDSRYTIDTNLNRDLIPSSYRYEGLLVYVLDPNGDSSILGKLYQLVGGVANIDWKEIKNETVGVTNDTFIVDGTSGVGSGVVAIGSVDVDGIQIYELTHNLGKSLLDIKVNVYFINDTTLSPEQREVNIPDNIYSSLTDTTNRIRIKILPPLGSLERIEIVLLSV